MQIPELATSLRALTTMALAIISASERVEGQSCRLIGPNGKIFANNYPGTSSFLLSSRPAITRFSSSLLKRKSG